MDFSGWKYKNGHWYWDNTARKLAFEKINTSIEPGRRATIENIVTSKHSMPFQALISQQKTLGCTHEHLILHFKETVDSLDQVRFRRYHRRKTAPQEPDVIIIQDIRDVVIFTIPKNQLSKENIQYFHCRSMDSLLRSLIIYFQYFMQVWEDLIASKKEAETKLFQPSIIDKENKIHDELADLRAMVSKAYFNFLIGAADTKSYHHIKSNKSGVSAGEKDVRFVEFLYQVCVRVVWIALLRRNRSLIEMELNRMLRSDTYNHVARTSSGNNTTPLLKEFNRVLYGKCNENEKKLLQRSNVGKEIFNGDHDYRMLAIGNNTLENVDERIKYLEIAYSTPEENLLELNVPVGILGYPRSDFDEMLTLRFARNDDGSVKVWPKMVLPEKSRTRFKTDSKINQFQFPNTPSNMQSQIRMQQCKKWIEYLSSMPKGYSTIDQNAYALSMSTR